MRIPIVRIALSILTLTNVASIGATVLFENFDGVNKTLLSYSSEGITGPVFSNPLGLYTTAAQSFRLASTSRLDSLQFMLNSRRGEGNLYVLITGSEANPTTGTQPDANQVLESIQLFADFQRPTVVSTSSWLNPVLEADREYWAWLVTDSPRASYGWIVNVFAQDPSWNGGPIPTFGNPYPASFASGYGPTPYSVTHWTTGIDRADGYALRVLGTPISAPSSTALFVAGTIALLLGFGGVAQRSIRPGDTVRLPNAESSLSVAPQVLRQGAS